MFEPHRLISGISALFGVWVFLSAFSFGMTGGQFVNAVIVGAAIFVLAGYSAARPGEPETESAWISGLAAVLGLWVIVSPFVFGAGTAPMWSGIISGAIVAVLSGYRAYEASESPEAATGGEAGA